MGKLSKSIQKQHIDLYRKLLLRRQFLKDIKPTIAYVPFIGDGDIAQELYKDHKIYGADIDEERVEKCKRRLNSAIVKKADCNEWPFLEVKDKFGIVDFDAFSNPYLALESFWKQVNKEKRIIIFGTDGLRLGIKRSKRTLSLPEGKVIKHATASEFREQFNFWWVRYVLPYITELVTPWRIVKKMCYLRGVSGMLYWGLRIER